MSNVGMFTHFTGRLAKSMGPEVFFETVLYLANSLACQDGIVLKFENRSLDNFIFMRKKEKWQQYLQEMKDNEELNTEKLELICGMEFGSTKACACADKNTSVDDIVKIIRDSGLFEDNCSIKVKKN